LQWLRRPYVPRMTAIPMAGYAGGFLGPLGVGLALDLPGGDGVLGWGLAFGHLATVTLAGLFILRRLGQTEHLSGKA
jgi:hypothetical protein